MFGKLNLRYDNDTRPAVYHWPAKETKELKRLIYSIPFHSLFLCSLSVEDHMYPTSCDIDSTNSKIYINKKEIL